MTKNRTILTFLFIIPLIIFACNYVLGVNGLISTEYRNIMIQVVEINNITYYRFNFNQYFTNLQIAVNSLNTDTQLQIQNWKETYWLKFTLMPAPLQILIIFNFTVTIPLNIIFFIVKIIAYVILLLLAFLGIPISTYTIDGNIIQIGTIIEFFKVILELKYIPPIPQNILDFLLGF